MTNPLGYQGIPKSNTPLVNADGTMNLAWYRFFVALQRKCGLGPGGQTVTTVNRIAVDTSDGRVISSTLYPGGPNASVAYYSAGGTHELNVYDIQTGQFVGRIPFTDWFGP